MDTRKRNQLVLWVALGFLAAGLTAPVSATTYAYLKFENLTSGETAYGSAEHDEAIYSGEEWVEASEFEFGARRDIAAGARSAGTFHADRVRAIVPAKPGVIQLMQWLKEGNDVKLSVDIFTNGEGEEVSKMTFDLSGGKEVDGRLERIHFLNPKGEEGFTGVLIELDCGSCEIHYLSTYGASQDSFEDLIKGSNSFEWKWATREY